MHSVLCLRIFVVFLYVCLFRLQHLHKIFASKTEKCDKVNEIKSTFCTCKDRVLPVLVIEDLPAGVRMFRTKLMVRYRKVTALCHTLVFKPAGECLPDRLLNPAAALRSTGASVLSLWALLDPRAAGGFVMSPCPVWGVPAPGSGWRCSF